VRTCTACRTGLLPRPVVDESSALSDSGPTAGQRAEDQCEVCDEGSGRPSGRHPAGSYFVLTFAISGAGFFLVGGRGFFAGTSWQDDPLFVFAVTALLVGPPVAGVVLTGLVKGRTGFRELAARLLKWRVGIRWYATALLTAPLAMTVVLLALSLLTPEFLPAPVTTGEFAPLLLGTGWGLAGGLLEELGWTGFAIPSLRSRHGVLATGSLLASCGRYGTCRRAFGPPARPRDRFRRSCL
jgi:membrane protease YdiL (CAAX protease family)